MATLLYLGGAVVIIISLILDMGGLEKLFFACPVLLIMFGMASIIDRLAKLEKFIYDVHKNETTDIEEEYGEHESWKCNVCGRVNEYYIDICGCGFEKSNNKKIKTE